MTVTKYEGIGDIADGDNLVRKVSFCILEDKRYVSSVAACSKAQKIYLSGGVIDNLFSISSINSVVVLCLRSKFFKEITPMREKRHLHSSAIVGETLAVFGGFTDKR